MVEPAGRLSLCGSTGGASDLRVSVIQSTGEAIDESTPFGSAGKPARRHARPLEGRASDERMLFGSASKASGEIIVSQTYW